MIPEEATTRPELVAAIKRAEKALEHLELMPVQFPEAHRAELEALREHLAAARTLLALADAAWKSEARVRGALERFLLALGGPRAR